MVQLSPAQVSALRSLPVPENAVCDRFTHTFEPLVLVRDAIPQKKGPPEIVAVLIDGWGRFIRSESMPTSFKITAWIIEDTDLVEEHVLVIDQGHT